jgi:hypothetical protein
MEAWRLIFRNGFSPFLSTDGLEKLLEALKIYDERIIQGATVHPLPIRQNEDWHVEATDAIAFCFWQGNNELKVKDIDAFFAKTCFSCDETLGEPSGYRHFLNWYDNFPRKETFDLLADEVSFCLSKRYLNEDIDFNKASSLYGSILGFEVCKLANLLKEKCDVELFLPLADLSEEAGLLTRSFVYRKSSKK